MREQSGFFGNIPSISYWVLIGTLGLPFCALALFSIAYGFWMHACAFYFVATFARLCAGNVMNSMGSAEAVNAWNNKYHRFVVIVLNAVVGVVLLGRLVWDAAMPNQQHTGPLALLTAAFTTYFIAAHFTRPNTFGARVRSATLTIVLIAVMTHLTVEKPLDWSTMMWFGFVWYALWSLAFMRLRQLQRRFDWPNR